MEITHRQRKTRIVATLGPASTQIETIRALYRAGADVFRLNMSHGSEETITHLYKTIRAVEQEVGQPIGILADLQGPKLRIGEFHDGPVMLAKGDVFQLDQSPERGTRDRVTLSHPEIYDAAEVGMTLLIDDGKIKLEVTEVHNDRLITRVAVGGKLSDRKGVNVPDVVLPMAALTEKDRRDLALVLQLGVDWVALSFVQLAEDVAELRELVAGRAGVLAKIEKPAAVKSLEWIIGQADAIMVARGDLGVELPLEKVPGLQKHIISAAIAAGKAVVVATQMLETMIASPVPTRAEVSDVANAVYDGADAVMLSGESAAGDFPVEAVDVMNRVTATVEEDPFYHRLLQEHVPEPEATTADAISFAARRVAETISARVIVTYTSSGSTALRAARERPSVPLLVLTPREETARRLSLVWGLYCVKTDDAQDFQDMIDRACHLALVHGMADVDDRVVITAGMPFGTPGKTNVLRIARVNEEHAHYQGHIEKHH